MTNKEQIREDIASIIAHDMIASTDNDTYEYRVEKATKRVMLRIDSLLDGIEIMIAEEIIIAQQKGQPTSRLTSLAVRLKEVKND